MKHNIQAHTENRQVVKKRRDGVEDCVISRYKLLYIE